MDRHDPACSDRRMATGVVTFFSDEEGWGAISSPDLPVGLDAFVHFGAIDAEGYRTLAPGDRVDFDYECAEQDGFHFRTTRARRL
jgi:CspA family cold shock protein